MYKYSLDKSSKKFKCPSCGKKTFVKYIETETSNYLEETIGRCDRESKCQYHYTPSGNKPLVNIRTIKNVVGPTCHDDSVLGYFGNNHCNNNFVTFLKQHFCANDITHAIKKYFVGTSNYWSGATIFWQVDQQMNIMSGKVMLYHSKTGKRVKKPLPHINWMHKIIPVYDFVLQQCLFGIHNLRDYKYGSTICIVESEKTAIIMSILQPGYLWLATGSKSNFKERLLLYLKNYNIIVYPDKSEFSSWQQKSSLLIAKGYNITCSNLLEVIAKEEGDDLVDILF